MIDPRNIEAIYPLSAGQTGLLFEHLAGGEQDLGRIEVVIECRGVLSFDDAKRAWGEVVEAQPALRSSIRWRKLKKPQLIVFRRIAWESRVGERDGSGLAPGGDDSAGDSPSRAEGVVLGLDDMPPWSWEMLRSGTDRFTLVWTCHHAFLDGWSASIVIRQWLQRVNFITTGTGSSIPNGAAPFRDMVRWLNARDLLELGAHWRKRLSDMPDMPNLATKRAAGKNPRERGAERITLSLETSLRLRNALREYRISGNVLAVAAWTIVLRIWCRKSRVVTGAIVSGRSVPISGVDELAGMYSCFVPVVDSAPDSSIVAEWLGKLKAQLIEDQERAPGSLGELEEWAQVRGLSKHLGSMVVYNDFGRAEMSDRAGAVNLLAYRSTTTARNPLVVGFLPGERWQVAGNYDSNLFEALDIRLVMELLQETLEVLSDPTRRTLGELLERLDEKAVPQLRSPVIASHAEVSAKPSQKSVTDSNEWRMVGLFRRVFHAAAIMPSDNFFELGGDSIVAVRLIRLIEREFDRSLPLSAVVESPTPAALATLVADGNRTDWKCLVALKPEGELPGLFCLHAGGLEVLMYQPLASFVSASRPVFGIQPPGLKGGGTPKTTRELAQVYVEELREAQPRGPYFLLGYCFGVWPMVAMAEELIEKYGESVKLVVVDTEPPLESRPAGMLEVRSVPLIVRRWIGLLVAGNWRGFLSGLRFDGMQFRFKLTSLRTHFLGSDMEKRRLEVERATLGMAGEGLQNKLPVECLLLRSREFASSTRKTKKHLQWQRFVERLHPRVFETTHRDILKVPIAKELAAAIEQFISGNLDPGEEKEPPAQR